MTIRRSSPQVTYPANVTEDISQPASPQQISAESLAVLSDPYSLHAYDTLLVYGDMTTRRLSKLATISEASLNQHMKRLETIGFVTCTNPDAPTIQRVWRASRGGFDLGDSAHNERYPEYAAAAQGFFRSQIQAQTNMLQDWIAIMNTWPLQWRIAADHWDYILKALTVEQLVQMAGEINEVTQKWWEISKQQEKDGTPNTRAAYVVTHAIPWPIAYQDLESNDE